VKVITIGPDVKCEGHHYRFQKFSHDSDEGNDEGEKKTHE